MKVTVLIALYKSGEFIESKIESIMRQTIFSDANFVFLNCQDLDNESKLIHPLMKKYKNIKHILFTKHINLYESWNAGINITQSDYVVNYNADDQWHPKYLEKCSKFLDDNKQYAIVSSKVLVTDLPNQVYPNWHKIWTKMVEGVYPDTTAGPCPMWRRSLHQHYGFFGNYRVIGDARFWEALHAGKENFGYLKEELVLYYMSPTSLERRRDPETKHLLRDLDLAQAH